MQPDEIESVSAIDNIIVLLGPPASQSDKDLIAKLAHQSQQTYEDAQIERLPALVDPLASREPPRPSELEAIFSTLLEQPVTLQSYSCTYIEKKDTRYPAVSFATQDIIDADGRQLAEMITMCFRSSDGRAALAEALGKRLGVEWSRVLVTYGPADRD